MTTSGAIASRCKCHTGTAPLTGASSNGNIAGFMTAASLQVHAENPLAGSNEEHANHRQEDDKHPDRQQDSRDEYHREEPAVELEVHKEHRDEAELRQRQHD